MSKFITFEGPDGSGKSTQISLLAEYLAKNGFEVYTTREPGGTAIGNQIRDVLHRVDNTEMNPVAEFLLYSASRAQLVSQVLKPMLAAGRVILCDRYADSSFAYQGYGRRLDTDMLQQVTAFATQSLTPDLTIYLDVTVSEGLSRKQHANQIGQGELNRMDRLTTDFYRRVRAGYLDMAAQAPDRWLVIDAAQSVQDVHHTILTAVQTALAHS